MSGRPSGFLKIKGRLTTDEGEEEEEEGGNKQGWMAICICVWEGRKKCEKREEEGARENKQIVAALDTQKGTQKGMQNAHWEKEKKLSLVGGGCNCDS